MKTAAGIPAKSRNQSLDVLRGIAVLLVMCDHYPLFETMRAGFIGVDLFFVLSGFLISGLLFQQFKAEGRIDVFRFILRRGLKIWPSLYVYLAVIFVVTRVGTPGVSLRGFAAAATFLFSYFPREVPGFLGPMWSLAVEEHFYIFLPLLLLALVAIYRKRRGDPFSLLPVIFLIIALVCFTLRCLTPDSSAILANRASHLRMDSLFAGVFLAYLYRFRPSWFQKLCPNYVLAIGIALIVPVLFIAEESRLMKTAGLSCLFVGFGCLLSWAVPRSPKGLLARSLAKIGVYSYPIYLWHRPISIVVGFTFGSSVLGFVLYTAFALVIGVVASKLIEMPVLRLRERILPAREAFSRSGPDHDQLSLAVAG